MLETSFTLNEEQAADYRNFAGEGVCLASRERLSALTLIHYSSESNTNSKNSHYRRIKGLSPCHPMTHSAYLDNWYKMQIINTLT